jgi:hypothetical protein
MRRHLLKLRRITMAEPGLRPRLLIAALSDHEGLSAALAAAQAAEAWLRGDGEAETPPPMLSLPAPTPTPEPIVEEVAPGAPTQEEDVPVDATVSPAPVADELRFGTIGGAAGRPFLPVEDPEPPAPELATPILPVSDPADWLGRALIAARSIAARGEEIRVSTVAAELDVDKGAASRSLRRLAKVGLAVLTGDRATARYRLVDGAPMPPAA